MPLKITVVRHGMTDANVEGWFQGQSDTLLNESGLNQARLCGERLKSELFDHAYCSDLTRCRLTLDAILAHHTEVEVDYLQALRERYFGKLQGESIKKTRADAIAKNINIDVYFDESGGETGAEFQKRTIEAWESIVKDATEKNYTSVLVVSHGGVIRNFARCWFKQGYKPASKEVQLSANTHGNTAVSVVDPLSKLVYEFNSTSHLHNDTFFKAQNRINIELSSE